MSAAEREVEQSISVEEAESSTALIAIEAVDVPAVFGKGAVDSVLAYIREQTTRVVPDISTSKGRNEIKSLAYRITRSRTMLDEAGKQYAADLKARVKAIDGNRKRIRDELDTLRDEIRRPLTEWEEAEAEKEAAIDMRMRLLIEAGHATADNGIETLERTLAAIREIAVTDETFGRRVGEALRYHEIALHSLQRAIDTAKQRVAEAAELQRLRQEAAEREAKETAAKARAEMEERAKREAQAAAERTVRERIEKAEREAREAKAAAERAERERLETIERQKAEEARRLRAQEEAQRREKEEYERRLADREHKAAINRAAAQALMEWGELTESHARSAIALIALGKVPNVSITY